MWAWRTRVLRVILAPDYKRVDDAAVGPLKPGEVGVITELRENYYHECTVQAVSAPEGAKREWNYAERALVGEGGQWDLAHAMLAACPEAAALPDARGWLPLHLAVEGGAPASLLAALLEAHPAAVGCAAAEEGTPLHAAVRRGVSAEIVSLLLQACPGAAAVPDATGQLPLHAALARRDGVDDQVTLMLAVAHPAAAAAPDAKGRTPLHVLFSRALQSKGFLPGDRRAPTCVHGQHMLPVLNYNWLSLMICPCDATVPCARNPGR